MDDGNAHAIEKVELYCPSCLDGYEVDGPTCRRCGSVTVPRGYCPICERTLLQPPGATCPKHDVVLVDPKEEPGAVLPGSRLVTVETYNTLAEANGPRLRLEAEGIPAFLQDERVGSQTLFGIAAGGLKLQVPEEFLPDARVLITQTWAPLVEEGDDPDDPWEGLGPDHSETRRRVMKGMIVVYLLSPFLLLAFSIVLHALLRSR